MKIQLFKEHLENGEPQTLNESWEYGKVDGVVYYDISYVNNFLFRYDIKDELNDKIRDIIKLPVAILKNIEVSKNRRGYRHGSEIYHYYEEFALDNDAECSLLVADMYELQKDGFNLTEWYKSLGYTMLGKLGDLNLMYKYL